MIVTRKPFFTLTAEEVVIVKDLVERKLEGLADKRAIYEKIFSDTEKAEEYHRRIAEYLPLLSRIKIWQDVNGGRMDEKRGESV